MTRRSPIAAGLALFAGLVVGLAAPPRPAAATISLAAAPEASPSPSPSPTPGPAASATPPAKPKPSASPKPSAAPGKKPAAHSTKHPATSSATPRPAGTPGAKPPAAKPSADGKPATRAAAPKGFVAEGVVRSENRVEIKSKTPSPIRRIAVQEGMLVKKGDLLVEMDNGTEQAQLEAAKAEKERATSALAEAEMAKKTADRELERNNSVKDLITEKELEMSKDLAAQAANMLEMRHKEVAKADAQLNLASAVYENTQIKAPFDGLVSRIYVRAGTVPKVADTTILDILSLEGLYIEVAVPLQYLKKVKQGMPARVLVEETHAATRTQTNGKVRYVYPEIDPATRMFRVKVDVEPQDGRVQPGMFAKVDLGLR